MTDHAVAALVMAAAALPFAGTAGVAAVQAVRDHRAQPLVRTGWLVGIVLLPVIGTLAWFCWRYQVRWRVAHLVPAELQPVAPMSGPLSSPLP